MQRTITMIIKLAEDEICDHSFLAESIAAAYNCEEVRVIEAGGEDFVIWRPGN